MLLPAVLLSALFSSLTCVIAQSDADIEYTTITPYYTDVATSVPVPDDFLYPTRPVENSYGFDGGGIPLACTSVCYSRLGYYAVCVLNATIATSPRPSAAPLEIPEDDCLQALCDPAGYNHIYQCVNCIIANGGESTQSPRPTRTPVTTSASSTVYSTTSVDPFGAPPWAPLNADNVNGFLGNITEYCSARGREVQGTTTVTATPTASAVYATTYTDGETVDIPHWTELETMSEVRASINDQWRSAELAALTSRPQGGPEPTATGAGMKVHVPRAMLASLVGMVVFIAR